jgi:O-antigen/teichoic acid export membrane protein
MIIPSGIMVVVFPAFSALAVNDVSKLSQLYHRTIKYILFVMTPIIVVVIAFAYPLLQLWLGDEFAHNSSLVVQILAIGMLLSSVARVPLNATQAIGRPDISAKCYLIQFPIVILALYFLTEPLGITGVALIYMVRIVVDTIILFHYGGKMLSDSQIPKSFGRRGMYVWIVTAVVTGLVLSEIPGLVVRLACALGLLSAGVMVASIFFLDRVEKGKIAGVWRQVSVNLLRKTQ